jgi:tRNA(Ile)-lysidine synthase
VERGSIAPFSQVTNVPSTAPAVRSFIRRHRLLGAGDRVAVALSGGSDSVALSCLLSDLAKDEAWDVAGLIHVNHGLRGAESDADEAFCRDQAARWHLPLHVQRVDVAGRAREARQSIEAAARHLRYTAFEAGAVALGATSVATGHTEDDQAETLLLRLVRGASSRGLAGIRVRRGRFVRPLLASRRADLRAWLAHRGQPFREDSSNRDCAIPRNRLRRDVVPVLEAFAPQVVPALGRAAALLADDETFVEAAALDEAARLVV